MRPLWLDGSGALGPPGLRGLPFPAGAARFGVASGHGQAEAVIMIDEDRVKNWLTSYVDIRRLQPSKQLEKTNEELNEVLEALKSGDKWETTLEFGDLLVTVLAACYSAGIDPGQALDVAMTKNEARIWRFEDGLLRRNK